MRSLMVARSQLCYMAKSDPPLDVTRHLSRGPEYICGWLMRRLLLRPLRKHATVGDLYQEYISRLVSILLSTARCVVMVALSLTYVFPCLHLRLTLSSNSKSIIIQANASFGTSILSKKNSRSCPWSIPSRQTW